MGSRRQSPLKAKQDASSKRERRIATYETRDDGMRRRVNNEKIDPTNSEVIRERSQAKADAYRKSGMPWYLAKQLEAAYQARLGRVNPAGLAARRDLLG